MIHPLLARTGRVRGRVAPLAAILWLVAILPLADRPAHAQPAPPPSPRAAARARQPGHWYSTRPAVPAASGPGGALAATPPADGSAGAWTNLYPELYSASAYAPTDVWAAGEYGHLLHYSGSSWAALDPPVLHGQLLRDIAMLSTTSGWIAAWDRAYQFDGTSWVERSAGLHTGVGEGPTVARLAPLAPDDVWAAGSTYLYRFATPNTLLHWDGSQWRVAGPVLQTTDGLTDVTMLSPTAGWAVGWRMDPTSGSNVPLLLHWDGTAWTAVTTPVLGGYFYHLHALAPDDLWITGGDGTGAGQIFRDHAGAWTTWATPDGSDPFDVLPLTATSAWASTGSGQILHWDGSAWATEFRGRFTPGLAAADGQVWAVGLAETVLHRDTTGAWHPDRGGPTTGDLYDVAVLGPDDAWAGGAPGTFLHYSGGTWTLVPGQNPADLTRLRMLSDTDGYGLAAHAITHWDGVGWTQVATPTVGLNGLAITGPGAGWAVGDGGSIWRGQDEVWAPVSSPTTDDLYAVAFDSPGHGWAVGGRIAGGGVSFPTILEYSGGQWRDRTPDLEGAVLYDLELAPGGAEGWAGGIVDGNGNAAVQWRDGTWSWGPPVPAPGLIRLAGEALGEVWALTGSFYDNSAYHYGDGAWQQQGLPTDSLFQTVPLGLGLLPGRGGWAVGDGGKILRYTPLAPGQRFYDVPPSHPFYPYIDYMAAHNIISGYADNTFHPAANITRGQLTKMVVAGLGWAVVTPASPTFADVPAGQPFYSYVETAAVHGIISGYACGGPGEPCDAQQRPYFRPAASVTRGQVSKIIVGAKGWGPAQPPIPTFRDVPAGSPFFGVVEQAVAHGILSGYGCGGAGEPCPGLYFRPGTPATRGQLSKILAGALQQP